MPSLRQIALDTETTGKTDDGTPGDHRIIEIGCVEIIDRKITSRELHIYLNPQREIDEEATRVHGMTWAQLRDCPTFPQIAAEFIDFIRGSELLIHNAKFDVSFLDMEFDRMGLNEHVADMAKVTDTIGVALKLHPGHQVNLDNLCNIFGINNKHRVQHGALLDARLLAEVYLAMTGGQRDFDLKVDTTTTETRRWQRQPSMCLPLMRVEPERHAEHVYNMVALGQTQQIGSENDQPFAGSMWGANFYFPMLQKGPEESKGDFKKRLQAQLFEQSYRLLNREECAALDLTLDEHKHAHQVWEDRVLGRNKQE